ncbi:MAG TPA: hypothetical protein VH092_23320 [Urbifossiella sp.]|nr:hypothetical protein [Urbifossiella sp.]
MRFCLTALFVLTAGDALRAQNPPPVIPSVVYRDSLFAHYRDRSAKGRPYVLSVRPLNDFTIRVTVNFRLNPRNNFESLFVRGNILAFGCNHTEEGTTGGGPGSLFDSVNFLAPDRLREAHLVTLDQDGKVVKPLHGGLPTVWRRLIRLPLFGGPPPGSIEVRHTAVAGDRDLLVFDLVRTVPAEGKAETPHRLVVTRVVPDRDKEIESPVAELRAGFSEPFQAYLVGEDYYFLTRSGSVYRSTPPPKGQPRTMAAVWDAPRPRVRFVVSDGHRPGVHFLVVSHERGWGYFPLGHDPRPQVLIPNPNETDPIEAVYEVAVALREKKAL